MGCYNEFISYYHKLNATLRNSRKTIFVDSDSLLLSQAWYSSALLEVLYYSRLIIRIISDPQYDDY